MEEDKRMSPDEILEALKILAKTPPNCSEKEYWERVYSFENRHKINFLCGCGSTSYHELHPELPPFNFHTEFTDCDNPKVIGYKCDRCKAKFNSLEDLPMRKNAEIKAVETVVSIPPSSRIKGAGYPMTGKEIF